MNEKQKSSEEIYFSLIFAETDSKNSILVNILEFILVNQDKRHKLFYTEQHYSQRGLLLEVVGVADLNF